MDQEKLENSPTGAASEAFPLLLPWLDPDTVAARNCFFRGRREVHCRVGGHDWFFRADTSLPGAQWTLNVVVSVGGHQAALYIDSPLPALWEGTDLDPEEFFNLPEPLQVASIEIRVAELLSALEQFSGKHATVDSFTLSAEGAWYADGSIPLRMERSDGPVVHGAFTATPDGLAFFAEIFEQAARPVAERLAQGRGVPVLVPLRAELVGPELTAGELCGVGVGDVLVVGLTTPQNGGVPVTARAGANAIFPARLEQGQLTIDGGGRMEQKESLGQDMEAASGRDAEGAAETEAPIPFAVRSVNLPVIFELGSTSLTVEEAENLVPGQVFTLSSRTNKPVRILVSGQCVGTGSLVDVGGFIGVQVQDIYLEKEAG